MIKQLNKMPAKERDQMLEVWQERVRQLLTDIQQWAEKQDWQTEYEEVEMEEPGLGKYSVPALIITTPKGKVVAEPKGRLVLGAEGRVDLYAYPTLVSVLLLKQGEEWIIKTQFGPNWPHEWGQETFVELAQALIAER